MAITAYIGVPGSGKSYEVVKSVIVPAVASGRRIVSNIYGLNYDAIVQYCYKNKLIKDDVSPGEIIHVENARVIAPDFYPVKGNQDKSLCQPGDLIILDECHRFFTTDKALSSDARIFAAEHRHYADEKTGQTCDLVLINQALTTLPRFLRERIEQTFRMKKLIGLSHKSYRVDIFDGSRTTKATHISNYVCRYSKDIFPLYSSHDVKGAVETRTDSRAVLFKPQIIVLFVLVILLSVYLFFSYLLPFFNPQQKKEQAEQASPSRPLSSSSVNIPPSPDNKTSSSPSQKWCVIGRFNDGERNYVFLRDTENRLRMVSANKFRGLNIMLEGEVDGVKVVAWSCNNPVSVGGQK
ncbi:zonular occludens toxin [Escherichia coli]|uniref:zonular occludens toxin domain-containing protein n=1 Tax=Escherichia coli TaxID=562 RepID=UPI0019188510|nr:zonular occludens toxin domain-containing protein [Escherichia coli]UMT23799.1 zonular occludens toxin [Escherichia coli]CAD6122426.1 phage-related membrane protein [Escherichia coli]